MERSADDARPVRRPTSSARLFAVYALVSLVPVAVLGVGINRTVRREIDERALAEALAQAETIADAAIEPAIGDADLDRAPTPEQRQQLARSTAALHGDATVLRLRIRSTTGTILFDADHPDAPPVATEDDEVVEAAEGRPVKELTRLGADEVDASEAGGPGVRAVETYVAFHRPGTDEVVGVLETYLPYAPFEAAAADAKARLTTVLALGLTALWGVLAFVSWSVTRRLRATAADNDWLAHHDPLTGLPNRLALLRTLRGRTAADQSSWVAIVDLDRFREINATIGHANADRVLRTVGERLAEGLAPDGTVARLSGDRFGALWPDRTPQDEGRLLAAIDRATAAPVAVGGILLPVDLTVGMAHSTQVPGGAEEVLRTADLTAHAAKDAGLPMLGYSPGLEEFDPDRLVLAGELGDAIAAGQLELHYQPKLNLVTGEVHSVEALVRWRHPTRGLLPPSSFIPIAESTSLIHPLTTWVLSEAVEQLDRWRSLPTPVRIAVNVSARNLADPGLHDEILAILERAAVPPERLEVEITETVAIADADRARTLLGGLRAAGVGVSLDDFGQGATSLVSLSSLPIDELKIDRAFVVGLEESPAQRSVVEFVVALGHRLGLRVVAEGVETEHAVTLLTSIGCDEGQGYLFCRPLPPAELEPWLAARHELLADVSRRSDATATPGGPVASPATPDGGDGVAPAPDA